MLASPMPWVPAAQAVTIVLVVTAQVELQRDLGGRHVAEAARKVERVDAHARPARAGSSALLDIGVAAAAIPDQYREAVAVLGVEVDARVFKRLPRGRHHELREARHPPRRFPFDEPVGCQSFTSPATLQAKCSGFASVMVRCPSARSPGSARIVDGLAGGVIAPSPVTTTRVRPNATSRSCKG